MRIAHVTDCFLPRLGGIEQQVQELAARQLESGHDVRVVTSVAGAGAGRFVERRVRRPARRSGGPRIRYETSWSGRNAVLAERFDVVHVHASTWSPLAFLTAAASSRAGVPTVLTAHSLLASAEPLFAAAAALTRWPRWPIEWSAVSTVAAAPLRRLIGSHVPISVLPNGVAPDEWRVDRCPHEPGRLSVITVGRLAERKRPRQLLRMLRSVSARLPAGVRLDAVLVGDGPLLPALQRYLDRTGMSRSVRLIGAADHARIRGLFADADLYIAPAHLESFGIAALEARCAGLPVLAHARSGVSDFVTHGVEGLLARDDADMAQRILDLATDPALLRQLQQHNRRTPPRISWDSVLAQHDEVYARAGATAAEPLPAVAVAR